MPKGDSVINHRNRDEITKRLLSGESVKQVELWLRMKYPQAKHLWISWMTLQAYRKERLNLEGEVLSEVKEERKELIKEAKEEQKKEIVQESLHYMTAKRKIAEDILNVEQEIVNIHDKAWERIKILEAEETKHLNDRVICEYLNQARTLMMDYLKLKESQEKKGNTNININMGQVDQQISVLKQCIRDALIEAGAEQVVPLFLEKLNERLQGVNINNMPAMATFNQVNVQVNNA